MLFHQTEASDQNCTQLNPSSNHIQKLRFESERTPYHHPLTTSHILFSTLYNNLLFIYVLVHFANQLYAASYSLKAKKNRLCLFSSKSLFTNSTHNLHFHSAYEMKCNSNNFVGYSFTVRLIRLF
jgi:hypothetical protein